MLAIPPAAAERAATRYRVLPNGCWLSTYVPPSNGYPLVYWRAEGHARGSTVHRAAYQHHYGPIPDGLVIDHICHDPDTCPGGRDDLHRACVNPAHLRAVSHRENTLRSNSLAAQNLAKTHCAAGHPLLPLGQTGHRHCPVCSAENLRRAGAARHERARQDPAVVPHGPGGYTNWKCRCDICKAAGSVKNREASARRRPTRW